MAKSKKSNVTRSRSNPFSGFNERNLLLLLAAALLISVVVLVVKENKPDPELTDPVIIEQPAES